MYKTVIIVHTFNRGDIMTKRKLKKQVVYGMYAVILVALFGTLYFIEKSTSPFNLKGKEDIQYVSKTIFDSDIPVVSAEKTIIKPYVDDKIKVVKAFYDYQADASEQEKALIFNENTYIQSSGVSYGGKEGFEVVAILDGTVTDIKEDNLLGKVIEVSHDNGIISVYQSLSDTKVKKDDKVIQGQVIGTSGKSNIDKNLGDHLYFELIIKGSNVNPEDYYDKKVNEL